MASSVFLDTSGWLAILNSAEALHTQANETWRDVIFSDRRIVLTDWIVAEAGNGLARSRTKGRLLESLDRLLRNPRCELVYINDDVLQRSLDFYARHADKSWGLVDCASFVVMQDRGISEAFTSDQHFAQAGFVCSISI
jgi:predicted nucleic acid-binding protein